MVETDGAGAAVATLVVGAAGAGATGAGAVAWTGAGAGAGAGFAGVVSATSSLFFFEPKPFRSISPSEPEKPGAVILMQDSASQWRGASIWMRSPLIWKVTPPAWAEVVAISNAAIITSFFMRASLSGVASLRGPNVPAP